MNFCHYFQNERYNEGRTKRIKQHNLIGRIVNTKMSIAMATYLEGVIERMAKKRIGEEGWLMSAKWSWDYRRGAFQNVIDRLKEERGRILDKEEKAARKAAMAGAAGNALTVAGYSEAEKDANYAFEHGEEALAEKKERAAYYTRAEAAYTIWAKENPKAAVEKFEFEGENPYVTRRYGGRYSTKDDTTDWSAYRAGNDDAKGVSLNPQAGSDKPRGLISGSKAIHL